jgi:hypothetical protein
MRETCRGGEAAGMKTWIVTALLLLLVPATASAGTITGKLPRKGKPMTVRVVRMDTAQIVTAKRIKRPKYRIKVARGPYMVFASAGKRRFKSRVVRVGKRGTRKAKVRAAGAGGAPLAIVGIDPNLTISGLEGYRAGLPIEAVITSVMFENECANGGEMLMVETANREALEREIELGKSKYFDPKTRVIPHWVQPDTIISGHGQVAGDNVTIDVVMRGKVNGSSSVTMPLSKIFEAMDAIGADLKGQICRSKDAPAPPTPTPPPPVTGSLLGYRGSLSGSATITSQAGVITESWTSTDVRFSRIPSSDTAPGYEITQGTLSFSVSGTVGSCTVSGAKAMPLAVAAGDAESALDLAPDDSYFAVGYPNDELDVTYTCPGEDGSFTMPYTAMNEFLRTDAKFVRRMPGPNGTISGTASATRDGKSLKWTWALKPLV